MTKYASNPTMVELIADVMEHTQNHKAHRRLRLALQHMKVDFSAYRTEWHEFMYADSYGMQTWCNDKGKIHCDVLGPNGEVYPAQIWPNGKRVWYINGQIHREDRGKDGFMLPAMIYEREKTWYWRGKIHRDERDAEGTTLPAMILGNGTKFWYLNGVLNRTDKEMPTKITNTKQKWHRDGLLHREVYPAVINKNGYCAWYNMGKLHRETLDENGKVQPAVIMPNGTKKYYYLDREFTEDELTTLLAPKLVKSVKITLDTGLVINIDSGIKSIIYERVQGQSP